MTDAAAGNAPGSNRNFNSVIEWYGRPDRTLQELVEVANIGPGVAVTLFLGWGAASGHVVASHHFYKAAGDWVRSQSPAVSPESTGLGDSIAKFVFDSGTKEIDPADHVKTMRTQGYDLTTYIHLQHVQSFMPGWSHPVSHDFLRVRLNAVTAWTYGKAVPSHP